MIPPPAAPPNPAWIAVGVSALGIVMTVVGWFVVNALAKRRERQRDKEVRELAAIAGKTERKRIFIASMAQLMAGCRGQHITEFGEFYASQIPSLRHNSELILEDLQSGDREKFEDLVAAACDLTVNDIYNMNNNQEIYERVEKIMAFVKSLPKL